MSESELEQIKAMSTKKLQVLLHGLQNQHTNIVDKYAAVSHELSERNEAVPSVPKHPGGIDCMSFEERKIKYQELSKAYQEFIKGEHACPKCGVLMNNLTTNVSDRPMLYGRVCPACDYKEGDA